MALAGCGTLWETAPPPRAGLASASNTDCQWYSLRQATFLYADASLAASPLDLDLLSRLSDADARARADEVSAKLDDLDRQAAEGKTKAGECFGEGGNEVAEKYALVQKDIAGQRDALKEALKTALAANKDIEEEQANFDRWRAENRRYLVRNAGGMSLEIIRIAKRDIFNRPGSNTVITIEATNTTTSRILKPKNWAVWGYEVIGSTLTDSFGNDYKLTSITPQFLGNELGGIRPGQTLTFELRFGDIPLQNAKSVRLVVEPGTLGQQTGTAFELPSEAFYGAVAKP